MFVKNLPADLISGFGIKNEETDELELLFEDYAVYAVVRELPNASSRFWLFEIGAWSEADPSVITGRSTPFLPLGDDVDDAAKLIEIMITNVWTDHHLAGWKRGKFKSFEVENGKTLTGQRWSEYAEFGDSPATKTKSYWSSVKKIKAKGMEN